MKLSAISMTTPAFRGYKYVKNDYGVDCYQFGYPHDTGAESNGYKEKCSVEIIPVKQNPHSKEWEYAGAGKHFDVPAEGGVAVNVKNLGFSKDVKYFAYRYTITGEHDGNTLASRKAFDTGRQEKIGNERYNIVSLTALKPTNIGAGLLALPDSFAPGFFYKGFFEENVDDIGKIDFDKNLRDESEKAKRTFSNTLGGTLAGYTAKIKDIKENGYTHLFSLPITGGDSISAFKYWPESLFQLAAGIGDMNNYQDMVEELYANGIVFVMDAPLTSEAMSGVHYQYAIKWGQQDNPMKKWFRMEGIESNQIGYGIVGRNSQGLSHYLVNAPHKFIQKDDGTIIIEKNPEYNSSKPTHMQYFDKDYLSESQLEKKELIEKYDKMLHDNPLATATHDDTVVKFNHILTKADYETYLRNLQKLSEINRTSSNEPIKIDSKDGTIYLSHLTKTKITEKNEAGVLTWVAHTDMIKYKYFDSVYDYKTQNSESVDAHGLTPSNCELIDQAEKYSTYWTKLTFDFQNLKTARELGNVKNAQEAKSKLEQLIKEGKLAEQAALSLTALQNIDANLYKIDIPELSAEDFINKTTMGLNLESLTLSKDTLGVLSTDYFSDRATTFDTIGMNRYELAQAGNPQITNELNDKYGYKKTYEKVNEMFTSEINDFVMGVLERANEDMPADRKIFKDETKTELTEYGYYVVKFMAEDIARYAITKALVPNLQAKVNSKGQILYDIPSLKENSSLQQIGIKAHTFKYEAELLADKMKSGLRDVTTDSADLSLMKDAVINRFKNTNANTFKYAEAIVRKAELGLTHRVDALKDAEDIDSKLNGQADYHQFWPNVEFLWSRFKKGYEKFNPNGFIVDEITDSGTIGGDVIGTPWSIAVNSEHTSEAGYTYFFTDPVKMHSGDGAKARGENKALEDQGIYGGSRIHGNGKLIRNQLEFLLKQNFPLDYFRTLYNFSGNHDKPRLAHLLAINPQVLHSDITHAKNPHRDLALYMITGASEEKDLPFDALYHSGDTQEHDGVDASVYINNNYFLGASTLAIASGDVIRSKFDKFLCKKGLISEAERDKLHNAVTLLVNGYNTIEPEKRPSYMNYNTAMAEVLEIAEKNGLKLPNNAKEELINNIHNESKDIAIWILKEGSLRSFRKHFSNEKYPSASGQIITLANILMQATNVKIDDLNNLYKNNADNAYKNTQDIKQQIYNALAEYIHKYPEIYLKEERLQHQKYNMNRTDNERNAFGALDFRQAIDLVFQKAGMGDREDLKFEVFKSINDPIRMKRNMLMRMMISLPGIPTTYAGDEFSMSGWEEKTENLWLQCRNSLLWSKLEGNSPEAKYYKEMLKEYHDIIKLRSRNGKLSALNTGTPYQLQAITGTTEINNKKENRDISAALTIDPDGSTVVSLFNVSGLSPINNHEYDSNAENPFIPILEEITVSQIPLRTDAAWQYGEVKDDNNNAMGVAGFALASGMVLKNVVEGDNTVYKVVKEGMEYVIKRFDQYGKQIDIVINNGTSQYGVFSLYKNIRKMPFFKGNSKTFSAPQYNIVANPNYFTEQKANECGSKLSILAK